MFVTSMLDPFAAVELTTTSPAAAAAADASRAIVLTVSPTAEKSVKFCSEPTDPMCAVPVHTPIPTGAHDWPARYRWMIFTHKPRQEQPNGFIADQLTDNRPMVDECPSCAGQVHRLSDVGEQER